MSDTNTLKQIEQNIKQAELITAMGKSLERLLSNRDYKTIIGEGYFEQEAIRLVHLKADPNMQKPESQADIVKQMDAIGALKQYFHTLNHRAMMAEKSVAADREYLEEVQLEGAAQ